MAPKNNALGVSKSVGTSANTYVLMHEKFALASGATHIRATTNVDTSSESIHYYGMNIRWRLKKTHSE